MAGCATHKGLRRGVPGLPTSAVLGLTVHLSSFCLIPFPCLTSLAWSPPPLPLQPPYSPWSQSTIQTGQFQLCALLFSTVNMVKRFVIEARLRQQALGQSLAGPACMNELSGSQFCDKRPRLHAGSDGGDIGSCQPHSKRGSHVRTTLRTDEKVGGARAWGCSERLFREYRLHLCFLKTICGLHFFKHLKTHTGANPHIPHKHFIVNAIFQNFQCLSSF